MRKRKNDRGFYKAFKYEHSRKLACDMHIYPQTDIEKGSEVDILRPLGE